MVKNRNKNNMKPQACGKALEKAFRRMHNLKPGTTVIHPALLSDDREAHRKRFQSKPEETDVEAVIFKIESDPTRSFAAGRLGDGFSFPDKIYLTKQEEDIMEKTQRLKGSNSTSLQIPRRPKWDKSMDAVELNEEEIASFNSWRRILSVVSNNKDVKLTPYEKNIEYWRQLWRVTERSDLLVQIVDARDPLLYYSEDLKDYVFEHGPHRKHLLLLNKADYLTDAQMQAWVTYFDSVNLKVVFFSALIEEDALKDAEASEPDSDVAAKEQPINPDDYINKPVTANRQQLIKIFESYDHPRRCNDKYLTIGLVGYPNVGKSSTINCLKNDKKVAVSATPGKTKHFQTLFVHEGLVLCDCPGLIFPAFVNSKAEMLISGILSIDHMKEFAGPIHEVMKRIPLSILEASLGIKLPVSEYITNDRIKVEELLNAYGGSRGYMAPGGMPDRTKAAREILKQFVTGVLLYCKAPPTVAQEDYFVAEAIKTRKLNRMPVKNVTVKARVKLQGDYPQTQENFVNNPRGSATVPEGEEGNGKWWRQQLKAKRNTHVKLRNRFPAEYL